MPEPDFFQQVILDEMAGKNNAIHGYDRIIWTIRPGYITLVFGGWGILIKGLIDNKIEPCTITEYIIFFVILTVGLAIGGFIIDYDYLCRKFKVIKAYNKLMEVITKNESINESKTDFYDNILPVLKIAGASSRTKKTIDHFKFSIYVAALIYFIPAALSGLVAVYIARCCY